ncbi:MAG: DUF4105 domain-containing protein [Flavobacterium sp.]|nr:DUF4105 domain-containing protein [Flavobacterium sp.]
MRSLKHLFKVLFLLSFTSSFSQTVTLSENAEVSVLTCGNGNEMYSLFGHTAIRINDPENGIDQVYNYGAFDFDTPNFVVRFSKGDLQYFVTAGRFADFLYSYNYEQRSVYEQTLNISQQQKQQLFDRLTATLISDERFYTYKFIDRNCTTMVVELLNDILDGPVLKKVDATDVTYREILYPYFDNHFYEQLGTSIIFGSKVDQLGEKIFLPIELFNSIELATYRGNQLKKSQKTWLEFDRADSKMSWWNNPITYVLLLLLVVVANNDRLNMIYFLIAGLIGTFFTIAGWYSYHGELANNYNALLLNPALLLLIYFHYRRNRIWFNRLAWFCIASILIYLVIMIGKIHLLIVLPIVLSLLIILSRYIYSYHKSIKT